MERIVGSYSEKFTPVILYFEDIQHIVSIMKEVSDKVTLRTDVDSHTPDMLSFDNVNEWAESGRDFFTYMEIVASNPSSSLYLHKDRVWLYIQQDTTKNRGAFDKIKKILESRRRFDFYLPKDWMHIHLFTIIIAPSIYIIFIGKTLAIQATAAVIAYFGIGLSFRTTYIRTNRSSVIYSKRRGDVPSFWKRNSEKLLVDLIKMSIGGVVGGALGYLIRYLTAK